MKLPALLFRSTLGKTMIAALALGGFLFFAGAPAAKQPILGTTAIAACRIRTCDTTQAVERFGPYSPAARHWAFERHEAYDHCRRDWR